MDATRFDAFARALIAPRTRRGAALTLVAGLLTIGSPSIGDAGKGGGGKKKHKKKRKKRDTNCARTCDGCCTADNVCLPAASQHHGACGVGGVDCIACADGVECTRASGACTCTANSCAGCCSADLENCYKGTAITQCGKGGAICQNCAIQHATCDAQQTCTCVAAGKFCTSSNECCDGLPCTRSKCAQPAGGRCTSDIQCVGELYLQYCRNNTCCAVQFGYCEKPADCCDPDHSCTGSSCSL